MFLSLVREGSGGINSRSISRPRKIKSRSTRGKNGWRHWDPNNFSRRWKIYKINLAFFLPPLGLKICFTNGNIELLNRVESFSFQYPSFPFNQKIFPPILFYTIIHFSGNRDLTIASFLGGDRKFFTAAKRYFNNVNTILSNGRKPLDGFTRLLHWNISKLGISLKEKTV